MHYTSLGQEAEILDEVPLLSDDGEDWGEEGEGRFVRRKWRSRFKSHSSFISWFCDGGWQLLLKKYGHTLFPRWCLL